MKLSISSRLLCVAIFGAILAVAPFSRAEIPLDFTDIFHLYGDPEVPNNYRGALPLGTGQGGGVLFTGHAVTDYISYVSVYPQTVTFRKEGLTISVVPNDKTKTIQVMHFRRKDSFGEFEIETMLGDLSSSEKWVHKDDKTWVLPKAGAYAIWDGNGKLDVSAQAPR